MVVVIVVVIVLLLIALLLTSTDVKLRGGVNETQRGCVNETQKGGASIANVEADKAMIRKAFSVEPVVATEIRTDRFVRSKKNAFIEFCYSEARYVDFDAVRKELRMVLKYIDNNCEPGDIFIYRHQLNLEGEITAYPHNVNGRKVVTAINLGPTFGEIHVPKTMDAMLMDEYIRFKDISAQVEYSEGLSTHKCNAIEFLLRMLPERVKLEVPSTPTIHRRHERMQPELQHDDEEMMMTPYVKNNELLNAINAVQASNKVILHFMHSLDLRTWKQNAVMKHIGTLDLSDVYSSYNYLAITPMQKFRLYEDNGELKLAWAGS